jgi:LAS superfamily LD-carboxypeptidase LdcB
MFHTIDPMKLLLIPCAILFTLSSCANPGSEAPPLTPHVNNTLEVVTQNPIDTVKQNDPDSLITNDFLMGKFNYRSHPLFVKVPAAMCTKELYIQKEALEAFQRMHDAALKDSISFKIVSGTRSFNEQKTIWETKWKKEIIAQKTPKAAALKILEYSSMPSTSRHHWGTDIDINSVEGAYFRKGKGLKEYNWLVKNANSYGFFQTYTQKDKGRTGYSVEEWHWSYLPLSKKYLDFYNTRITNQDIKGFTGSETAVEIDIIKNFVNGIEKY